MKRISTLFTAFAALFTVQVSAQTTTPPPSYTENFENTTPSCIGLTNTSRTSISGEVINGTSSLITNPAVNSSSTRDYNSPYLNVVSSTLTFSFWFKLSEEKQNPPSRTIEIGLESSTGSYQTLTSFRADTYTSTPHLKALYSYTTLSTFNGAYRLVIKMSGDNGGGTVRTIIDDITINANTYYSGSNGICNTAPLAVNDNFITIGPITENVFTNNVGGTDNDVNAGETFTATLVSSVDPLLGTLTFNGNTGTFTFTPTAAFATAGSATFTYQLTDNGLTPATSNIATVRIAYSSSQATLPIKLLSFSGNAANNRARLSWSVADNETGDHFQVLRSNDGKNYNEVGTVLTNTKVGAESYSLTDATELAPVTYYKLKIINKDRSVSYSNVIVLKSATTVAGNSLNILQNPVGSTLNFAYTSSVAAQSNVVIYNAAGAKVFSTRINTQKGANAVSFGLDSRMAPGTYILEVANATERSVTKLIKK